MERLTKRDETGIPHMDCNQMCADWHKCNPDKCQGGRAIEKLAEYEDAEEQGLLLKLPCKVGDTVYEIIEESVPHHHYYISEYEVEDVSAKEVKYCGEWIASDCETVYFSKEEAEQALAEMK